VRIHPENIFFLFLVTVNSELDPTRPFFNTKFCLHRCNLYSNCYHNILFRTKVIENIQFFYPTGHTFNPKSSSQKPPIHTILFKNLIPSRSYWVEIKFWSLNIGNLDLDLEPTGPNVKLDMYLVMLHMYNKKCFNLWGLSGVIIWKPIVLVIVTVTLTLNPQASKSNSTCKLWCYIYVQ
jgi:hypothetical protein